MSKQAIEMIGSIDYINNFNEHVRQDSLFSRVRESLALRLSGTALATTLALTACEGEDSDKLTPQNLGTSIEASASTDPSANPSSTTSPENTATPTATLIDSVTPLNGETLSIADFKPAFTDDIKSAEELMERYLEFYEIVQTNRLPDEADAENILDLFLTAGNPTRQTLKDRNMDYYRFCIKLDPSLKDKYTRELIKIVAVSPPDTTYWDIRAEVRSDTPKNYEVKNSFYQFQAGTHPDYPGKTLWKLLKIQTSDTQTVDKPQPTPTSTIGC